MGGWASRVAQAPRRSTGEPAGRGGAHEEGRGDGAWPAGGRLWRLEVGGAALGGGTGLAPRLAAPYRARAEWPRGARALPPAGGGRTGRGDQTGRGGRCFSFAFPGSEAGAPAG